MSVLTRVIVFVGVLAVLGTCSSSSGERALARPLKNLATQSIVPGFVALETEAKQLEVAADQFCASPSVEGLESVQSHWRATALQWNRVAFYRFGPLYDDVVFPAVIFIESMRQRGTDYTETVRAEVSSAISGTAVLDDAYFQGLTFTKVGLLSLEILSFEDAATHSTDPSTVLAEFQTKSRKCDYLEGMSRLLVSKAAAVRSGWDTDYAGTGRPYVELFQEETLPDGTPPEVAAIDAMVQHLEYVKKRKLDGALDARLSGAFDELLRATVESLESALSQDQGVDPYGLYEVMAARGENAKLALVQANFQKVKTDIGNRESLSTSVGALEQSFRNELPAGLGVNLGLNFTDGD